MEKSPEVHVYPLAKPAVAGAPESHSGVSMKTGSGHLEVGADSQPGLGGDSGRGGGLGLRGGAGVWRTGPSAAHCPLTLSSWGDRRVWSQGLGLGTRLPRRAGGSLTGWL